MFALATLVLLSTTGAAAGAVEPKLGLSVKPCILGKMNVPALCGTFGVYENRAARSGRIIELGVAVLKAPHPRGDAIAFIEGGPGQPTVVDAAWIADDHDLVLKAFRKNYDVVFVDNRGMGVSNPTHCNISPYSDMPAYFLQIWSDGIISGCYYRYARTSNPSQYNTNNAVDDLDAVREALGYRKLVLYGGSYGSFFSFIYIRRHEAHVRSAVLEGIVPPHFEPLPGAPDGAQTALDDLVAKCLANVKCRERFPKFRMEFDAVLHRFDAGPVRMQVRNPKTKRLETVSLSKEVFVDRVRENLYAPETAAFLPYIIQQAYRGNYVPLGQMVDLWSQFLALGQDAGSNLAYRCAEFDPFLSDTNVQQQAANSFTGDLRIRAERHACAIWKVDPMPAAFNDPLRSSVPILMVNGSDDPVTPPRYAQRALATLPNAKLVIVRGAGHGVDTTCTERLMIAFIETNSAKNIASDSCGTAFKVPPFETSMENW